VFDNPLEVQKPPFDVVPNPSPEQQSDIAGQWKNWLANEGNRAALMQFGVAMMAPMGFGQNVAGHVGQAVGSVGELATRRGEAERKDRETDSRAELRSAQATVAEARAANAGSGAARAADRLSMERERLAFDKFRFNTSTLVRLQTAYQRAIEKINADNVLLPPDQRKPIPTFQQFVQTNPQLAAGIGMGGGEGAPDDTASPSVEGGTHPEAPRDPKQRVKGQTYNTPQGPLIWEGTGWRRP
jgi:hypothetical protein